MVRYGFYEFPSGIARWMVLGILLAGAIAYFVPDDFFSRYLDSEVVTMLLFLLIGIPFYTCSTGSIPIAAALMMKGLSPGAAFVFLVVGPVTSIASITLILKLLGKQHAILYLATIVVSSLIFGFLLNLVASAFPVVHAAERLHAGAHVGWRQLLWALLLTLVLGHIFVRQFLAWIGRERSLAMDKPETLQLFVEGMTCQHCVQTVTSAVKNLDPEANVHVDLKKGLVDIASEKAQLQAAITAIEGKGYSVKNDRL